MQVSAEEVGEGIAVMVANFRKAQDRRRVKSQGACVDIL